MKPHPLDVDASVPITPDYGTLDCRRLWTCETEDPQITMRVGSEGWPQYLQSFRQSALVLTEEVEDGSWVRYLRGLAQRQFNMINEHLLYGKRLIVRGGVVEEGSVHYSATMMPFRMMDGWAEFINRGIPVEDMMPGLLFLEGRMFKILKPYHIYSSTSGGERMKTSGISIVSEVGLGLRPEDENEAKKIGWREWTMMDEVDEKLKELGGNDEHDA